MILNDYQQIVTIWIDHQDGIHNYILKKTKDVETAKEISQQVLMKMIRSCCKEREIKNIRSWLFQIAHNATIDYWKQQEKLNGQQPIEQITHDVSTDSVWQELATFLEPLIAFLPEKYGIPLKMYAIQGIKQTDIAKQLNLELSTTKSRILRAKKLLQKEIENCCHLKKTTDGQLIDFAIKDSCQSLQRFKIALEDGHTLECY